MNRKKVLALLVSAALAGVSGAAVSATGPSSSQSPYLVPVAPSIDFTSIITTGDTAGNGYTMVGIPDGLGVIDNGSTFTLFMNHELGDTQGITRAHGAIGAFVSQWEIQKSNLQVLTGKDLIQTVNLWDSTSSAFAPTTYAFNRLCSADLPAVAAFYNSATGLGTTTRFFMNGEETSPPFASPTPGGGRAFAHTLTGGNAGTSYEFYKLGNAAWENVVARPYESDKTIVAATDDTNPTSSGVLPTAGRVYVYFGDKQSTGSDFEKAGLANGTTFAIKVGSVAQENRTPDGGLGLVGNKTAVSFVSDGTGTNFLRPEDVTWDTKNPNRFYFVTTDNIDSTGPTQYASRLFSVTLNDPNDPSKGGVLEMLIDGLQAGQPQMMDNITVNDRGEIIIQEDVGNNARLGKIWSFDPVSKTLTELAQHDPNRFLAGGSMFLTQDEESSGVIDVTSLFNGVSGYDTNNFRYYLLDVQSHLNVGSPDPLGLVQGGQLLLMAAPVPEPSTYALMAAGLIGVGAIARRRAKSRVSG